MKENKITLKFEDGKKSVYDVLFEVKEEFNYIIYTNNKLDNDGLMIVYFGKYKENDMAFKNINKKEEEKLKLILNKFRGKNED